MPSIEQLSTKYLSDAKDIYIADLHGKDLVASGNAERKLRIAPNQGGGKLYGADYMFYLKHGRKPGKFPPLETMENWIIKKGITPDNPKTSIKSLAFLFARAIAEKGTQIFQKKRPGLNVDKEINELTEKLVRDVGKEFKANVIDKIKKVAA